jgi:uncharacterized damage-inducible protein DinB
LNSYSYLVSFCNYLSFRTRDKTIALLKSVPPKLLAGKAKGEDEALGQLFHHIAATVDGWMMRCMKDGGAPPPTYKPSKPAIMKALRASQKRLPKHFAAKGGKAMSAIYKPMRSGKTYRFTGRDRVHYLTQHEVHHRGKIVLALRQWGFTKIPFMPYDVV